VNGVLLKLQASWLQTITKHNYCVNIFYVTVPLRTVYLIYHRVGGF